MKLVRMTHLHGWIDDADQNAKVFGDLLGLNVEEREYPGLFSSVIGNGRDKIWTEFIIETIPHAMKPITISRKPHLMAISYKVEDMDKATEHLKKHGVELVHKIPMGVTRQYWYTPDNGIYLELSEYPGDDILGDMNIDEFPYYREPIYPENKLGIIKFSHTMGWTENAVRAEEFYKSVYGFETAIETDEESNVRILRLRTPGDNVYWELFQKLDADALAGIDGWEHVGLFGMCFQVKDLDAAAEYMEANGVRAVWKSLRNQKRHIMFSSEKTNGINIELCE